MDPTLKCLAGWLPSQRWFSATTRDGAASLRLLADIPLDIDDPSAAVRILIVAADAPAGPSVYQVPIVRRRAADAASTHGLIGVTDAGEVLIDGPHDSAFTTALLHAILPGTGPVAAEVLVGEQSNTSIIYRPTVGRPIICKVFRPLSGGLNPDIELQTALADSASPHVPAAIGVLEGRWSDPLDTAGSLAGSLAFAQEFFPDVEDAWRVALRAAATEVDFAAGADALGRATGEVHLDLARLFPAPPADAAGRAAITEAWRRRLSIAVTEVPALLPLQESIRECYARAAQIEWPSLQRIHGDYHLGQVLQVPGRGWVLLDFEGEPMRPMRERLAPDLAFRDIAGMLRSFDYVAGSLTLARDTDDERDAAGSVADAWSASARASFLAGYRAATATDPAGPLLDALELDKAVYEAIYEARHRPEWLPIPLTAISRLVAR